MKIGHNAIGTFFKRKGATGTAEMLVVWRRQVICHTDIHKVLEMATQTPGFKKELRYNQDSMEKATGKEMADRITNR